MEKPGGGEGKRKIDVGSAFPSFNHVSDQTLRSWRYQLRVRAD